MWSEGETQPNVCPECGAPVPPDASCQANLDALEWDMPGGPGERAHLFAVATYGIQHPGSMGYTEATVDGLVRGVRDVLDGRASIAGIRTRMRALAALAGRVTRRDGDTVPRHEVDAWPIVVMDAVAGGVEGYPEQVAQWARPVVEALDPFHR